MNTEERIETQKSLWRRVRERFTELNISQFVRSVQSAFICGKSTDEIQSPIYTGPQITVPWRGEAFKYPEDRYLSNNELRQQLNILEMRFVAQSHKLDEYACKQKRMVKTDKTDRARSEQFERIGRMVAGLQDDGKTDQ
ncbi:hypothetical protein ACF0H5_001026 [Mactra antiquata]